MPIDYEKLLNWHIPEVAQTYTQRDTMLYALGVGAASRAEDTHELKFVYEAQLQALPMMAVTLGYPGLWMSDPATGIDWKRMLHGEQGLEIFRPLPTHGSVIGRTSVSEIWDRGEGKGAIVRAKRDVIDAQSGELLCRLSITSFLRGDGGFGGPANSNSTPHQLPQRPADIVTRRATNHRTALIYRLSGDYNPLHVDPELAKAAGFPQPILHGLCTFGVTGLALIASCCPDDASRLSAMKARFTAPVFPGETIETEIWTEENGVSFRSRVVERDLVVLDNGSARVLPGVGP